MKIRILTLICAALTALLLPFSAHADAVSGGTFGDFEYDVLTTGTLEIRKYNGRAETVAIPQSIGGVKVTYIGWNAFKNCTTVKRVDIPEGVTTVGKWAFFECKSLETVSLPKTLRSVSAYAFEGCDKLQMIVLPRSLGSIGESAFASCTSLQGAYIPADVVSINESAFFNCPDLTIRCYPETDAAAYAEKEGINISYETAAQGDVDYDGSVTSSDAMLVIRYSVGLGSLGEYRRTLADVNKDGAADSTDALTILRQSAGL